MAITSEQISNNYLTMEDTNVQVDLPSVCLTPRYYPFVEQPHA